MQVEAVRVFNSAVPRVEGLLEVQHGPGRSCHHSTASALGRRTGKELIDLSDARAVASYADFSEKSNKVLKQVKQLVTFRFPIYFLQASENLCNFTQFPYNVSHVLPLRCPLPVCVRVRVCHVVLLFT